MPISNLTIISKLLEHVAKSRLNAQLCVNCLLLPNQPAYRKLHTTKTTPVYPQLLHHHLLYDSGRVTALALLNLPAAFNIVDHTVLLLRLEH